MHRVDEASPVQPSDFFSEKRPLENPRVEARNLEHQYPPTPQDLETRNNSITPPSSMLQLLGLCQLGSDRGFIVQILGLRV